MSLATRFALASTAVLGLLATAAAFAQQGAPSAAITINGVSVVDPRTGKTEANMAVTVSSGKIIRITKSTPATAKGAHVVDAHGKFLVPGFWEMHGHPIDSVDRINNLTLMLANGITGVRQMSGSDALLADRKAGTLALGADSPELLAMPGNLLFHPTAATAPQAIAEIDKQKAEGADFIKTIDMPPPVFFAALDEAKKVGLPYDGHLSTGVDAVKASEAGMRGIEHLGPQETVLIGCSTDEANIRAMIAKRLSMQITTATSAPAATPAAGTDSAILLGKNATSNPTLMRVMADPSFFPRLQHIIDTYSEDKCRSVAKAFAANNTWQIPTLIRIRTMEITNDPAYTDNPNLQYVAPATRQLWSTLNAQFAAKVPESGKKTLAAFYALQLKMAKLFDDNGVKMLAGSDFGGMWLVAGYSLHQEFDELATAGFTPLRILQMTTSDAANFLGRDATDGTIAVGKNANLVLLEADPLTSAANLHKIAGVVRAGKFYTAADLTALKHRVASSAASAQARLLPAQEDDGD